VGQRAMGNAKWLGVRLRDVLDLAGVKAGRSRSGSGRSINLWSPVPRTSRRRSTSIMPATAK
jgi:hypothetical protein